VEVNIKKTARIIASNYRKVSIERQQGIGEGAKQVFLPLYKVLLYPKLAADLENIKYIINGC